MGIAQDWQKIRRSTLRSAAVLPVSAAALLFTTSVLAADQPKEPAAETTPVPEQTDIPRRDVLNLKKTSSTDALLVRDWMTLSLLKIGDLPGLKSLPDSADQGLRTKINQNFGLPAVMTMRDPAKEPPQWWNVANKGLEALTLGPTRHWSRPELVIELPLLRLREIPYLQGDSDSVRLMNEVVRLWMLGRTEQAQKLREQLQVEKKKIPRGTLERTAVGILNGFLDLQLASSAQGPGAYFVSAQSSFWDALGSTELKVLFQKEQTSKEDNQVDDELFRASLAEPAAFQGTSVYPPNLAPPKIKARTFELQNFVRTLALPALFNVASIAAKKKNWTRVYEASQKFDEIYDKIDKKFIAQDGNALLFTTPSGVAVTHPLLMLPQSPHHLQVMIRMLKVKAQFIAEDPLFALKETARVILDSRDSAFRTLGFTFAGNIYDDLGYPNYARRFYAFAEAFANIEWYQQNPYFLLSGAENAFWSGDYRIARAAFEKFLLSAGDKQFGPWARLRLAEMTHLQEGAEKALTEYESLLRSQPQHPAGLIAQRRVFCMTRDSVGPRARHLEYMALKEKFSQFEPAEVEQVRACHLTVHVEDAKQTSTQSVKALPEEAALQLSLIDEFKKKFPESAYLKFFEQRTAALQAAMGPYLLALKQCGPALEFVRENQKNLKVLENQSGKFLSSLKWTQEEHDRLLRCAALFSATQTLTELERLYSSPASPSAKRNKETGAARAKKKISKSPWILRANESPDRRFMRMTIAMTLRPEDPLAVELLKELRKRGQTNFIDDVRALENQQSQSIDDPKFWTRLATLRVMQWDLEQPPEKKTLFRRALRAEILRKPEQTIQKSEFCQRFVLESNALNRTEWDSFVLAIPTARWLEILSSEEVKDLSSPSPEKPRVGCALQVAHEALRNSQTNPSLARDKHLLWPWLQARGVPKEQEAWLALGQRWSQERSVSRQDLENIFRTLEKDADDPLVRQAAKAWRESQKPSNLW